MSLDDIDDLPDSIESGQPGHREAHQKVHKGLKALKAALPSSNNDLRAFGIYMPENYGGKVGGIFDNKNAIEAAIADMPSIADSYGGASYVLRFGSGKYYDTGNHIIPSNKRIRVEGIQAYSSIIVRGTGSTGDWWTINGSNCGISKLTLDCPMSITVGDSVVLNGPYSYVQECTIPKAAENAITVGKAAAAILWRVEGTLIRNARKYGVQTISGSGSTDGMMSNTDIGQTGWAGVRFDTGSQNCVNVHVWGSGVESSSDNHGFYVNSSGNIFSNCQSETNLGSGVYFAGSGSRGNAWTGGKIWGNCMAGISGYQAPYAAITGAEIYRNGVKNPNTSSLSYAGIFVDAVTYWTVTGNNVWDDTSAIPAGEYTTAPTYPYPGRAAGTYTQTYAYAGQNSSDWNMVSGNSFVKERQKSGSVTGVGNNDVWGVNHLGGTSAPTQTVSSGAVRVPAHCDTIIVSTAAEITSVVGHRPGRRVSIIFTNATPLPVRDNNGTLNLNGDYTPTQGGVLSLVSDGTNWYETSRTA